MTHFDLPTKKNVSTRWLECLINVLRHHKHSFHHNSNYPILDTRPSTLPTLTMAQTLLYWSDCLMVALRHWDNSFYHCYPPHFNTLPSLYMNVFLTIGACWIRTHVKPISLIYRAGTSKFKRDPPGVQNTGRTTCLQQIKEPI